MRGVATAAALNSWHSGLVLVTSPYCVTLGRSIGWGQGSCGPILTYVGSVEPMDLF